MAWVAVAVAVAVAEVLVGFGSDSDQAEVGKADGPVERVLAVAVSVAVGAAAGAAVGVVDVVEEMLVAWTVGVDLANMLGRLVLGELGGGYIDVAVDLVVGRAWPFAWAQ